MGKYLTANEIATLFFQRTGFISAGWLTRKQWDWIANQYSRENRLSYMAEDVTGQVLDAAGNPVGFFWASETNNGAARWYVRPIEAGPYFPVRNEKELDAAAEKEKAYKELVALKRAAKEGTLHITAQEDYDYYGQRMQELEKIVKGR